MLELFEQLQYVKSLHTIMRVNQLDAADAAYLAAGKTIWLAPVERD